MQEAAVLFSTRTFILSALGGSYMQNSDFMSVPR